jgi:hypothetical protein
MLVRSKRMILSGPKVWKVKKFEKPSTNSNARACFASVTSLLSRRSSGLRTTSSAYELLSLPPQLTEHFIGDSFPEHINSDLQDARNSRDKLIQAGCENVGLIISTYDLNVIVSGRILWQRYTVISKNLGPSWRCRVKDNLEELPHAERQSIFAGNGIVSSKPTASKCHITAGT